MLLTGATGGIGQAIARALDERGARLQLTARRTEQLEQIAAGLNGQAEVLPADLADARGAAALAERAGKVDVLVANAGLPASGPIDDFICRADRPRPGREPAGADPARRARCCRAWSSAAAATSC